MDSDILEKLKKQTAFLEYLDEVCDLIDDRSNVEFELLDVNIRMMENYIKAKRPPEAYVEWYCNCHRHHHQTDNKFPAPD